MRNGRLRAPWEIATLSKGLARLRGDRRHGAQAIAWTTLRLFGRFLRENRAHGGGVSRGDAMAIARALLATQPAMAVFRTWGTEWGRATTMRSATDRAAWARRWAQRWRTVLRAEPARLRSVVARRFPPRANVVTLSNSSTLGEALLGLPASRRPSRLTVLESLPGGEGRRFARALNRGGLTAQVVPDRSGPTALRSADLLLLGADAVEPDGAVVHKVGTRALARSARRLGVPVVVLAGRSKWLREGKATLRPAGWFDRTPAGYISAYWTDGRVGSRLPRRRLPSGRASAAGRRGGNS